MAASASSWGYSSEFTASAKQLNNKESSIVHSMRPL